MGECALIPFPHSQTFEVLFMMYVKNKTLNQGSWALKATLLLSRKHRNVIIPAVQPHPLPSHRTSRHKFSLLVHLCIHPHFRRDEEKGGKLSTQQPHSAKEKPGKAFHFPLHKLHALERRLCLTVITAGNRNPQPPKEAQSPEAKEFVRTLQDWVLVLSWLLWASPVTVSLLLPVLQKFRPKKAFFLYTFISSPGHSATQSRCSFLTQPLHLDFTSTIATHGQDKHCAHDLTLPKAPPQTHTTSNKTIIMFFNIIPLLIMLSQSQINYIFFPRRMKNNKSLTWNLSVEQLC